MEDLNLPDWYRVEFDSYCLEVGRLSVLWAAFENRIDSLIWELLDVEATKGACLTAQMIGPGPRVRALQAIVDETDASRETKREFQRLGKKAEELGGKRNRYEHDTVTIGATSGLLWTHEITANKKLRIESKAADIQHIRALWIEIRSATQTLLALRFKLIAELPTWQRTRYKRSISNPLPDTPDQD